MIVRVGRRYDKKEWHAWFAWRPVLVRGAVETYLVWLEGVQRKREQARRGYYWMYRF